MKKISGDPSTPAQELKARIRQLEALFKNSLDGIAFVDSTNRIIDINSRFAQLFGYELSEIKGANIDDILDKSKPGSTNRNFSNRILTGETITTEGTRYTKEGQPLEMIIQGIPIIENETVYGAYAMYTDVTEQKKAAAELKKSEQKYREILSTIKDGYFEVNLKGKITFCNNAAAEQMGYHPDELRGKHYHSLCKNPDLVYKNFSSLLQTGKSERALTVELIRKDGTELFGELTLSVIRDKTGNVQGFRGLGRDITERKKYEEKLRYLSLHDQLTGLYNRSYFENELERLDKSREYPITIIVTDLDGLKLFNDTVGHEQGDRLLKECAGVLRQSLRGADILARIGGDEFVIILPKTNSQTGKKIVERIKNSIDSYNRHQPGDLPLSISIGLATVNNSQRDLKQIFKEADDFMYREKLHKGIDARSQIISSLMTTLGERDYIAQGHTRRVELLCLEMGKRTGLSKKQLLNLSLLAQVHDLGKVGIPDQVLFKKKPLSKKEW
ncbi:MAG: PAS domain S-box protein [Bacillota bacterium]|nr:PAS domain S-box protein [Bacillota bacterium]